MASEFPQAFPKQKCHAIFALTPSMHCGDHVRNPLVVVFIAGKERQPCSQILNLKIFRAGGNQFLHLGIEYRRQREAEFASILVMLEVNVPCQIDRARAHGNLKRFGRGLRRDLIEVGKPDRAALHLAAVDHPAPIVKKFHVLGSNRRADRGRMRVLCSLKAVNSLVHVPAERADDADVIVVPHLAVGDDVEAGFLLIVNHRRGGVLVGLFVADLFEGNPNVAAQQLLAIPARPRI